MKELFYLSLGIFIFILFGFTRNDKQPSNLSDYLLANNKEVIEKLPEPTEYHIIQVEEPKEKVQEETIYEEEYVPAPSGRWIWAKVTAYTNGPESCGQYADGFTSIMVNTNSTNPNNVYGIAANPRVLSYGTSVYVPGYWEMLQRNRTLVPTEMTKIDDTGVDMRRFRPHWRTVDGRRVWIEAHLDIRVRQVRTALNWGVKYLQVFVYE